jgi:hypothetical protein
MTLATDGRNELALKISDRIMQSAKLDLKITKSRGFLMTERTRMMEEIRAQEPTIVVGEKDICIHGRTMVLIRSSVQPISSPGDTLQLLAWTPRPHPQESP